MRLALTLLWLTLPLASIGFAQTPVSPVAEPDPSAPRTLRGGTEQIVDLAYFADGKRLIGGGGTMVRIWNVADGSVFKAFDIGNEVTAISLAPDGSAFAVHVRQREFYVIDIAAEKLIHRHTDGESQAILFSPDSKGILFAVRGGEIRLLDLSNLQAHTLFSSEIETVRGMSPSKDGKLLAITGSTPPARAAARTGRRGITTPPPARGNLPGKIALFNLSTGLDRAQLAMVIQVPSTMVRSPAFSADGRLVAAALPKLHVWTASDATPQWAFDGQAEQRSIAFSPDNRLVAIGNNDATVRLLLSDTGRELQSLSMTGSQQVPALEFAPDGKTLAAANGKDVMLVPVAP